VTLEQTPRLEIRAHVSVSTVVLAVSATLLAMPSAELCESMLTEAKRNPALLVRQRPVCHRCLRVLVAGACPRCGGTSAHSRTTEPIASVSAWEQLRSDALTVAPRALADVITAVLTALDDRGLLPAAARDVLQANGVEPDRLAHAVQVLREVGPPGIAAADPAESLVVQLESAPLDTAERELARRLLTVHAGLIADGDLVRAAELEGCAPAAIESVLGRLRRLLRPYPGFGEPGSVPVPPAPPDLIFEPDGAGVRARITERETLDLSVDPGYAQVLADGRSTGPDTVRAQLRDAGTVIRRVHRRWSMLQGLGDLLAEHHADHLLAGSLAFRSLTQAQAAQRLAVHESTISRAVAHRCARLVSGEVVPLRRMFGANHDVRAAVAELCATVPRPSDRVIAELLAERGIVVSRRAVNKYRRS
jgi:RNA polymerase sigma-54 factor